MRSFVISSIALLVGCGPGGQIGATSTTGTSTSAGRSSAGTTGGTTGRGSSTGHGTVTSGSSSSSSSSGGSCIPTLPNPVWTSPYAGFSNGVSSDPSFFPLAVWLQGSWHAMELAGLGLNTFVGNNAGVDPLASSDLATLQGLGLFAILGQDSTGLGDLPSSTITGWWLTPDEPDNAQPVDGGYGPPVAPATLVSEYRSYKAADPTRPIYLGLGQGVAYPAYEGRGSNAPAESGYAAAGDILSFDIYPYNNCAGDANDRVTCGQFWLNAHGVDLLRQWSTGNQAVWTAIETTVISAGTDAGPTPVQTASEVWLSLIHGANGIEYFIATWNPSFREDGIFADPAMVSAVTALDAQITALAPQLNSASLPGAVAVTATNSVDTMAKASGQTLYLFTAIADAGIATANFTVTGLSGSASASVIGESRSIPVSAGQFSDTFGENGVHIYSVDLSRATCP